MLSEGSCEVSISDEWCMEMFDGWREDEREGYGGKEEDKVKGEWCRKV